MNNWFDKAYLWLFRALVPNKAMELEDKVDLYEEKVKIETWDAMREVLLEYPDQVDEYKQGRANAGSFLMGKVMRKTEGRADPHYVYCVLSLLLLGYE